MAIIKIICSVIYNLSELGRKIGSAFLAVMMVFISFAVAARFLGHPIIGDNEIVQFNMVILIVFGLSYTEMKNGHISIGILVDRFSPYLQRILDMVARVLTISYCFLVVSSFIYKFAAGLWSSELLRVPFMPFKVLMIIGFALWGLEVFRKTILSKV